MSKKYFLLILFVFQSIVVFSQDKNAIAKGFITIVTNQKIEFTNLRYEEDKVVFTNVETKTEFTYFLNTVRLIEDHNKKVIYRKDETSAINKTVSETTKLETPKLETEKSIAVEAPIAKTDSKKLEFKGVSNIQLNGKKLSADEVRNVLSTNQFALKEYNSGKSTANLGNFSLELGVGLIVGGGISNLNKSKETTASGESKGSPTLLIVGIAVGIIAIPITLSGKNKVRRSIDAYNFRPVAMQNEMDIDFVVNGNGAGFTFKF